MLTTVQTWSGREARALRQAMRASIRDFAAHLGVSARMVSKWEAGGEKVRPRPDTQAILDTCLERASREVKARFVSLIELTQATLIVEELQNEDSAAAEISLNQQLRHPIDEKTMVKVEAGAYLRGEPAVSAWLPTFFIDVYPVTNVDYAKFVTATDREPPPHWPAAGFPAGLGNHPVVGVSHTDAEQYAHWAHKTLPSAEEWEKAARGSRGAEFPWGVHRTAAKCNVRETGIGTTTPVNRYHSGISPYGVYDLGGNVWEWCSTESSHGRFVLKGSAFTSALEMARGSANNDASPAMFDDDTGFRCVSSPGAIAALQASR